MITVCHVLLPISSAGIVRASSVFPILSTILLLLGGLCVGAGRIYNSKNNIILSAGILFVAAGMFSLNWVLKKCCLFGTENAKVQLGGEATSPARCPVWPNQGQGPKNTTGQSVLWVQLGGEVEGHRLTSTALLPLPEFPSQSLDSFRAFSLQVGIVWSCSFKLLICWYKNQEIPFVLLTPDEGKPEENVRSSFQAGHKASRTDAYHGKSHGQISPCIPFLEWEHDQHHARHIS